MRVAVFFCPTHTHYRIIHRTTSQSRPVVIAAEPRLAAYFSACAFSTAVITLGSLLRSEPASARLSLPVLLPPLSRLTTVSQEKRV